MTNTIQATNIDKAISDFLQREKTRQPLFGILVVNLTNSRYFFDYAKDVALFGLKLSDTAFFKDDLQLACLAYDNRYFIENFSEQWIKSEVSEFVDIDPRYCDEAKAFWVGLGSAEVRRVCFDFNLYCEAFNLYDDDLFITNDF